MHYFISAGEPSGDLHASQLITAIRHADPQARFTFLGGDLMADAARCQPVIHYRRMAFMGFSEVIRHLPAIMGNFSIARKAIADSRPDAVILVDYPSFNLRLARYAKEKLGLPVFYYIAPKVWAWKEWRVKQLRRFTDRILSILPFETEYFASKGVDVTYVGNPSREEVDRMLAQSGTRDRFLSTHNLPADKPLLALVPGSRRGEIRCNLPVMDAVARSHPEMQPVIAAAPGLSADIYDAYSGFPRVEADTFRLMHFARAALVTSGTATLECALAATPQVVCYRSNGSRLAYTLMSKVIKAPFVSLPNLIASHRIIPEMLLHQCIPDLVNRELNLILPDSPERHDQLSGYELMRRRLGDDTAAAKAAKTIISNLK